MQVGFSTLERAEEHTAKSPPGGKGEKHQTLPEEIIPTTYKLVWPSGFLQQRLKANSES